MTLEPVLSKLLHGGQAPNARDAQMLALLDAWHRHGSSRLDRTDPRAYGQITDPGAAIMDTAWPLLAKAWASSVLGAALRAQLSVFAPFDEPAVRPAAGRRSTRAGTSTWTRTCARCSAMRVRGKFAIRYCGAGQPARCRRCCGARSTQAGTQLARTQQGPNPATGTRARRRADLVRARFAPVHDALHQPPDRHPADAELLRSRARGRMRRDSASGPSPLSGGRDRRRAPRAPRRHRRASSVGTIPRRTSSSANAAAPSTRNCHVSLKRPGQRDRRAEDRADRRRPGPGEKRLRAAVGAQPLEVAPPIRIERNDGTNATAAARIAPPTPWAAYPTAATVATTGPGVTWPSATALRNCRPVIQWYV